MKSQKEPTLRKMISKEERYEIEIVKVEKSDEKDKLRCYFSYQLGESYFDINKKEINKFLPGKKYQGIFSVSGMKDFLEEEEKEENICTWSHCLEKIINKNNEVVFESESEKEKKDVLKKQKEVDERNIPPGIIR